MKALRRSIILFSAIMLIGAVFSLISSDIFPLLERVNSAMAIVNPGVRLVPNPTTKTIAPGETATYKIYVHFEGYKGKVRL